MASLTLEAADEDSVPPPLMMSLCEMPGSQMFQRPRGRGDALVGNNEQSETPPKGATVTRARRERERAKRRGPQDFERSLRLLERTLEGCTLEQCGKEFGMNFSRVGKLVRWTVQELLSPERLLGETPPPHCYDTRGRRRHAEFWWRQIGKARRHPQMPPAEPPDLQYALEQCVKLLNYYLELANRYDGRLRRTWTVESWLSLLTQLELAGEPEMAPARQRR